MLPQPSFIGAGQFHGPPLPMWPEGDARLNGYKQQVSVNVNGGKHQQDPSGHWHHSGGTLHRPRGNNDLHVSQLKDTPFRDVHSLNSRLDAGLSSDTSGEDIGEERKKQVIEGPYSGSMGMFAYPGTPQRLFPRGQRNDAEFPNVANVAMGSPGYERATRTHCPAQYSGGHAPHIVILYREYIKYALHKVVVTHHTGKKSNLGRSLETSKNNLLSCQFRMVLLF